MTEQMTIGQLAAAAGVNVETVRYYQRRALLAVPGRPAGGIGRYAPSALTRLRFIKRAQSLGFTLDDETQGELPIDRSSDAVRGADALSGGEHRCRRAPAAPAEFGAAPAAAKRDCDRASAAERIAQSSPRSAKLVTSAPATTR